MSKPNPARTEKKERRSYQKHGHYRLKSAVKELGSRAIDRRTSLGKALEAWKRSYIDDLGGPEAVSTGALTILDKALIINLLVNSIDAWLSEQESVINKRKKSLYPVIKERQTLVDSLARLLGQLGLERREKPVQTLEDLAEEIAAERERKNSEECSNEES